MKTSVGIKTRDVGIKTCDIGKGSKYYLEKRGVFLHFQLPSNVTYNFFYWNL